jgi:thiosulfate sulfurtransferase
MDEFEQIDVDAARRMMKYEDVSIVDIRDEGSYREAHIKGAISLNDKNMNTFLKETDKKKSLICYCYHGMSSQSAAQYFVSQGFKNVYSLIGGFEQWRQSDDSK